MKISNVPKISKGYRLYVRSERLKSIINPDYKINLDFNSYSNSKFYGYGISAFTFISDEGDIMDYSLKSRK